MLSIGLTGNLGSGKSTVAALFQEHGAYVLQSDLIGRDLMQPGEPVFQRIVAHFGPSVLTPRGALDRPALARLAFAEGHKKELDALNAIVHPAVIARQVQLAAELFAAEPTAVLLVESALIFEATPGGQPWYTRFDRILLVTAPEPDKISRFVQRMNPSPTVTERLDIEAEGRRRLAQQLPDSVKIPLAQHVITNNGSLDRLARQVDTLWPIFQQAAKSAAPAGHSSQPKSSSARQ